MPRRVHPLRRRGEYVPIVDNSSVMFNRSDGSLQGATYFDDYRVLEDLCGLAITFSNWCPDTVTLATDPITVRATIQPSQWNGISARIPVLYNGKSDIPIDPQGLVTSYVAVDLPADTLINGWFYVSVETLGQKWPLGVQDALRTAANTDATLSGTITTAATEGAYHPVLIEGIPANPAGITSRPVLLYVGDSILASPPTSSYASWLSKAINGQRATALADVKAIPVHLAVPGEGFDQWVVGGGSRTRMPLTHGASHALINLGVNGIGSKTAAELNDSTLALATMLANRGIKVLVSTLTPVTDTDGSTQTLTSDQRASRDGVNAYRRAGLPIDPTTKARVAIGTTGALVVGDYGHPVVADAIDVAASAETTPGSNTWLSGTYTSDGTHPSAAGSTAIATGVRAALLTALGVA